MGDIKIGQGIVDLQNKIGLKDDFFKNLLNEDDWSFVIKLHALIEAIMTSLLVFHFNEKKLTQIFSRLEMSNKATGKLAFLKETGLLGDDNLKYIYNLSELRNKFVHNVENCNIELIKFVESLDKNQLKNFATFMRPSESVVRNIVKMGHDENLDKDLIRQSEIKSLIDFAIKEPKTHIWLGAYSLLVSISDTFYYSDYLQSIKAKELFDDDRKIFE